MCRLTVETRIEEILKGLDLSFMKIHCWISVKMIGV